MAQSNAERQQRYRERRKEQQPRIHYRRPQDRRSWPQRWRDAVQTLVDLQAEYQDWFDNLPDNLQASPLAERLEAIWGRLRMGAKRHVFAHQFPISL